MSENAVQVAQEALRAIKAEPVGGARWILGADSNVLFLRGSKQVKGKPAAPYAMVTVFNDGTIKTEIVSKDDLSQGVPAQEAQENRVQALYGGIEAC